METVILLKGARPWKSQSYERRREQGRNQDKGLIGRNATQDTMGHPLPTRPVRLVCIAGVIIGLTGRQRLQVLDRHGSLSPAPVASDLSTPGSRSAL